MMAMRMWDLPRVLGKAPCGISGLGVFIYFSWRSQASFLEEYFSVRAGFSLKKPGAKFIHIIKTAEPFSRDLRTGRPVTSSLQAATDWRNTSPRC